MIIYKMPKTYKGVQARKMARTNRMRKAFNALKANVRKNTVALRNTVEGKQMYRETSQTLANNTFQEIEILDGLAQGVADTATGSTTATDRDWETFVYLLQYFSMLLCFF